MNERDEVIENTEDIVKSICVNQNVPESDFEHELLADEKVNLFSDELLERAGELALYSRRNFLKTA